MTDHAIDTYLGWESFSHAKDCKNPREETLWRSNPAYLGREGGPKHTCANEYCDHQDRYDKLEVRILCRSCGVVRELSGVHHGYGTTLTAVIGYGLAPTRASGLWLYPGEKLFRDTLGDPWDYMVSEKKLERLREADVVGVIGQGRGKRGAVLWSAAAHPIFRPSHFERSTPDVTYRTKTDQTFKTITAAARWIAARLEEGPPSDAEA
ncbi:hypothetical protein ACWGQT_00570 [Streptomyces yangpuensis]